RNFQLEFLGPVIGREDVEVILRSGTLDELLSGLETLNLDIILADQPISANSHPQIVAHRLSEQAVSIVGPPQIPRSDPVELVQEHPIILPTGSSGIRTGFQAWLDREGLRPTIAAEVDDVSMIRLLASNGAGLAPLPLIAVQDEVASGKLTELAALPGVKETFYALTMPRRFANRWVDELLASQPPPKLLKVT
ncbi:MAG: LysR substrate-binding domain-containing protein, partial [Pseudomonadota bacterium]